MTISVSKAHKTGCLTFPDFIFFFSGAPNQWSKECSTEQLHDIHPQLINKKESLPSF